MEERAIRQTITIVNGKALSVNGVKDIAGCDENVVYLNTSSGRITVEGNELKIESLEKESGNVIVSGDISGVFRSESVTAKKGFFGKIFG